MGYAIAFVAIGLFFLALHYFTELKHRQKITASFVVSAIIFSALIYNTVIEEQSKKTLDIITRFKLNQTIKCQNRDVNNTNFSLSVGTYTFVGKNHTSAEGLMISVSACE